MERASTCSLGAEGGVTELRCYQGFKFHTQPAARQTLNLSDSQETPTSLASSSSSPARGRRQEQELKPPAVEASTWNACCRADKPSSRTSLHTKASQGHCPKGVAWQVASFLPSPSFSLQTATIAGVKSVPIPSCFCALFPFVKIVIYSVLNFSLLAPQISHNKTFNVVTEMLQQAKRGKKGREEGQEVAPNWL